MYLSVILAILAADVVGFIEKRNFDREENSKIKESLIQIDKVAIN